MLNKRGALFIEYAMIFAFILITGSFFVNSNFADNILPPVNKVFNIIGDHDQKKITSADELLAAMQKINRPIYYSSGNRKNGTYENLIDFLAYSGVTLNSGSVVTGWVKPAGSATPSLGEGDNTKYNCVSEIVHKLLADDNYTGYENITWSTTNDGKLYVYAERQLTKADTGKTFNVISYDLKAQKPQPVELKGVTFAKGQGEYGYLKKK